MNAGKTATPQLKVSLLLTPEELFRNHLVLQSIHILKSPNGIEFQVNDLVRSELERHFSFLSADLKNALLRFQSGAVEAEKQSINQRFTSQRAGVSAKDFKQAAFLRHFHQLFQNLLASTQELKCYHKAKKAGTERYQTVPCSIRSANLRLSFNVVQTENSLGIQTIIDTGSETLPLEAFSRYGFLLEKDLIYYIVSLKDFQTLQWLTGIEDRLSDPQYFSGELLNRLEASYPVNRNGLLEEKEIKVAPTSRVMLSELNNAYLLLTPQWLYDDILIDGPFQEITEVSIKGERVRIARDAAIEKEFLDLLAVLHPNFENQRHKGYYYLSFADAQKKQWFSKAYHRLLDQNIEIAGIDMLRHFKYSQHKVLTTLTRNSEDANRVHCTMTVSFGNETIPLAQLQKAVYAGQRAILLKDGSLGVLNDEWFDQYGTIIKHGQVKGTEIIVSKFLALPDAGKEQVTELIPVIDRQEWWQKWRRWQGGQEGMYPLPESVSASLRPYQQKGFDWLVLMSEIGAGGCLADDMGLGKTLQAICYLARYAEEYPSSKHIIVCPTSLVYNWQQELQKFASHLDVEIFQASLKTPLENAQILVISYGLLRNNRAMLSGIDYGVAILDESHNIKNPEAQTTKAAHEIRAKFRVTLSGTPVINNTEDLYSQLEFSIPGLLGTREFFRREYAHPIDRHADPDKILALQKLTAPFILRRTKKQVATDLPEKTQSILWCTMGASQKILYNNIRDRIKSQLLGDIHLNGLGKSKLAVLQGLMRLRQVCNDPRLLPVEDQENCRDSVKVEILMDELSNVLGDHKVLVFSQFSSMLALLAESATRNKIPYFLLEGKTPAEKRMEMVNAFQESGDAPSLFFISLKAGNTGLTLTAADYVFLFDPWWNTAVEDQAVDRTYRIGQTRNVFAYKMICKDSIEERIIELQNRKKFVADELITADESFVSGLTEEDLMYLLQ